MTEGDPNTQKPAHSKAPLITLTEEKPPRSQVPAMSSTFESPLFHEIVPAFGDPIAKLTWLWRKDLASKAFLITIVALLVISLFFAFSASTLLSQLLPRPVQRVNIQPGDEPKVSGTVELHPTFSVGYDHSNGTQASSLPPKSGTIATTSGTSQGNVQIVNIPGQVSNGDTVQVTVSGQPGTTVKLVIQYNADPYYAESSSQTIDGGGNATLSWDVQVTKHGRTDIVAQVTAMGGSGQSGTVTVPIN